QGEVLQKLDLSGGGFDGANLAFSVKKGLTGDGLVNVGFIDSTGHDLRNVTVPGDLGRILAGDTVAATQGVKNLTVGSMGRLDLDTQAPGGDLGSFIKGSLGSLNV